MMVVYYYHARPPLHLESSSPDQDWITCHLELAWSQALWTIQRKKKPAKVSVHTSQKKVLTQSQKQEVAAQALVTTIAKNQGVNKLITSKEQILTHYPDVFEGIGKFPNPPYSIQLDPGTHPKQTPYHLVPIHVKESFKQE